MTRLAALSALLVVTLAVHPTVEPPRVVVDAGTVEGVAFGRGLAFRGIPYAAAPAGADRWKPPRQAPRWDGVRRAHDFGPACPQPDREAANLRRVTTSLGGDPSWVQQLGATSEDCLSVNVFTERLDGPPRPVMVWIHGGANRFGSGKDEAAALVPYGVVVVTLNYRLGLLGFLAHPALRRESPHASSGNYALLDQIEALRWVQRNVAAFGGDPRRVTLFGHSAGGDSIAQLLASPLARGLFHRAIIHSGGLGTSRPRTEMEAEGVAIATRLGAPPDDPLPSLRALPSERLIAAGDGPFDASADGWLLPVAGPGALAPDADPALPLLVGATSDEANVFALRGDLETYRALVDESPAPWRIRVAALYPATNDREASAAIAPFMTARDFVCPARYVAARRRGPTWLYRFALPPRPGPGGRSLGAFHGTDVHLLFDRTYGLPRTEAATKLGDAMRHAWARFAATGDPDAPGFPAWRPYDRENPRQIVLDAAIDAADARDTRCDVFDAMWNSLYAGG